MRYLILLIAMLPACAPMHGYPPDVIRFHYPFHPLIQGAKSHPYQPDNLKITRRTDAQVWARESEFYQ